MTDYFNSLTHPQIVAFFAAVFAISLMLRILICIIWRNGICPLPGFMMFGFWGSAITPWLIFVANDHKDNLALIAHERCHQEQQRRDGTLTFWWRYITDKTARQDYEIEAYRVWLDVAPNDRYKVIWWLTHNYNAGLNALQITTLLDMKK